jgi:hypothetical protein
VQSDAILAFCTFTLLAGQPASRELVFAPEEGSSLIRRFVYTSEGALDDMSLEVDGEDLTAMIGEMGIDVESTLTYAVTDDFVEVEDGKILQLTRTFEELGSETEANIEVAMSSETTDASASSELVGSTVLFTWDEETEEYEVTSEDGDDLDQDLLDGLEMSMDLSSLLPPDEVEEGDRWEVEMEGLFSLVAPGGDLALRPNEELPEMEGLDPEMIQNMMADYRDRAFELMEEWVDGEIEATFTGVREIDGRDHGVITLSIDFAIEADMAAIGQSGLDAILEQLELPVEVDVSVNEAQMTGETTGEGELLWDLEGGFGRELQLSVDYEFAMEIEISADMEGASHSMAMEFEMSGLGDLEVTAE